MINVCVKIIFKNCFWSIHKLNRNLNATGRDHNRGLKLQLYQKLTILLINIKVEVAYWTIRKIICKFAQLRNTVPFKFLKIMHYSIVAFIISCGIFACSGTRSKHFQQLLIIHKFIIKATAEKCKRYYSGKLHNEIEVFNFPEVIFTSTISIVRKYTAWS